KSAAWVVVISFGRGCAAALSARSTAAFNSGGTSTRTPLRVISTAPACPVGPATFSVLEEVVGGGDTCARDRLAIGSPNFPGAARGRFCTPRCPLQDHIEHVKQVQQMKARSRY